MRCCAKHVVSHRSSGIHRDRRRWDLDGWVVIVAISDTGLIDLVGSVVMSDIVPM